MWTGWTLDLRTTWRALRRRPAYTLAVVATLGVAVAFNLLVIEMLTAALWRPLPFHKPGELVRIWEVDRRRLTPGPATVRTVAFWAARLSATSSVAALYRPDRPVLLGARGAEDVRPLKESQVSVSFFDTLGIRPRLGQGFKLEETTRGARIAVISDRLWQQLGADPDIIGRRLARPDDTTTVIGVMPQTFDFPSGTDLWTPLFVHPVQNMNPTAEHHVEVIARLRPGVTVAGVNSELATLAPQMAREFPATYGDFTGIAEPLQQSLYRAVRPALSALYVTAALLFIGSLSSGIGLVLARSGQRRAEWHVRSALGATPLRLARLALLETATLSTAGTLLGLGLAIAAMPVMSQLAGRFVAVGIGPRLHGSTWGWAAGLAILATGFAFIASAASLAWTASSPWGAPAKQRRWVGVWLSRDIGYLCQVALAATLLFLASLATNAFARFYNNDAGFVTHDRVVARIDRTVVRWREEQKKVQARTSGDPRSANSTLVARMTDQAIWDDLLSRVRGIPGVKQASLASAVPLSDPVVPTGVWRADDAEGAGGKRYELLELAVGSDYFDILRIPLRRGRLFSHGDGPADPAVVIVNETAARLLWPGADTLGRRLRSRNRTGIDEVAEVIGVVADTRHSDPANLPEPQVFWSTVQNPSGRPQILVAVESWVQRLEPDIRSAARAAGLTAHDVRSYDALVAESLAGRRLVAVLMTVTAIGVLLLTLAGVYGAVAQVVEQRGPEMAIRSALGARPPILVAELIRRHLALGLIGVGAGVGLGITLARIAQASVIPTVVIDPLSICIGAGVPLLIVLVGSCLPAVRLAGKDLVSGLRTD